MTEHRDTTLSGDVTLDDGRFIDVTFRDAKLIYSGGLPPTLQNCRFHETTFEFTGAAGNTLVFLKSMAPAATNMRAVVEGLIPELRE